LQAEGYAIGVVTSVPISHATPACAYANNVNRSDYQDLTRDLVGLPSISHPGNPLAGVDVLIGAGSGETKESDSGQGDNFVPGRRHITDADLAAIDATNGGRYRVVERTSGKNGREWLLSAATDAAEKQQRLFGLFGHFPGFGDSHLPFATADGRYDPTTGLRGSEVYSAADIAENPTLAEMTEAALTVLERNPKGFWLMIEAGEVDWANHDNNLDNSIGAVKSGVAAFQTVVDWVERHDAWEETAVIVTADHGHYLFLTRPEALLDPTPTAAK
jgi:alkaline phosphatase